MNPMHWENREKRLRQVDITGTRELRRTAMYALAGFCIVVGMILYVAWLLA